VERFVASVAVVAAVIVVIATLILIKIMHLLWTRGSDQDLSSTGQPERAIRPYTVESFPGKNPSIRSQEE
jgi:hypothetical protein